MTTLVHLRKRILELVPRDRSVDASDIVATLAHFPSKAVWGQLVCMAIEGVIAADTRGRYYDGHAMVRRLS